MPTLTAATCARMGLSEILRSAINFLTARESATNVPVMAAVRVPPSACNTSQSTQIVREPNFCRSTAARMARPIRRWISDDRPSSLPLEISRGLRSNVE